MPVGQKWSGGIRSAVRWLVGGRAPRSVGIPILGLFETLDASDIAERLRLTERGTGNGMQELPAIDQATHDDVEQDILQTINTVLTKQKAEVVGTLRALRDMVASLSVASQLGQLRLKARHASSRFAGARSEIGGELYHKRTDLLQHANELADFRDRHRLTRMPREPSSKVLTYGLLILLIAGEAILNAFFFAKGSEQGLIGGFGTAVGISIVNVLSAFFAGSVFARWINHRSFGLKISGVLGVLAILGGLCALHLFSAHYRDALIALTENRAFAEAIANLKSTPLLLKEINSYYLLGLGWLLAVASFSKGIRSADPYPGYWETFSRARVAALVYDDAYGALFGALEAVRDETVESFENALANIPQQSRQADQANAKRATLIQNFVSYEEHLEQSANRLLSVYYQANRANRTTPPPRRFNESWRLSRAMLSDSELELIGDGSADTLSSIDEALAEIQRLQDQVLGQYEDLVNQADRPGTITEELKR